MKILELERKVDLLTCSNSDYQRLCDSLSNSNMTLNMELIVVQRKYNRLVKDWKYFVKRTGDFNKKTIDELKQMLGEKNFNDLRK